MTLKKPGQTDEFTEQPSEGVSVNETAAQPESPKVEPTPQPTAQTQTQVNQNQFAGQATMSQNQNQFQQAASGQSFQGEQTPTAAGVMAYFQPRYFNLNQGDADANRLMDTINDIVKDAQTQSIRDVHFTVVSKNRTGTFAVVVVSIPRVIGGLYIIGQHALIMETSRPPIENLTQPTQNGQIEIIVPSAEAYDSAMVSVLTQEVAKSYKVDASTKFRECGFQVIYRETDINNPEQVSYILHEATKAIDASLREVEDQATGTPGFSLDMITKVNSIRVSSRFSLEDSESRPNGLPVRSDIVGELIMSQQDAKNTTIPKNQSYRIAKSAAYVDLIYAPPAQTYGGVLGAPNYQGIPQPQYIPRITVTQLETDVAGSSLEFTLLGLANLAALNRNRAYGVAFRDSYNRTASLRNLGAIGWQCPYLLKDGTPGQLNIESEQQLRILMDTVMYPSPVFTLEIENGGMHSWALNQLSNAARGNATAQRKLVDAANQLTGGRFSSQLARIAGVPLEQVYNVKLIEETQDQNHLGYYTREGERQDLRTLDLVAILNIANGDATLVQDYLSTLVVGQEPPMQRLDRRLRIFKKICADVVVKGYTNKYNFTSSFIEALVLSIEASDFKLNASNMLLNPQQQVYTQNIQDWQNSMVNPNIGSGLFQVNQYQPNIPAAYYNIGQTYGWMR